MAIGKERKQKRKDLTMIEKQSIIEDYKNGVKTKDIYESYGISPTTLGVTLNKFNIEKRPFSETHRTFSLNQNYFDVIDIKDKAYFLGLLMSDGCNFEEGFSISLVEQDSYILDAFKRYINYGGDVRTSKNRNNKIFSVYSKKLSDCLSKHSVVPRKTHVADFPTTIPENLYNHFIRGVFDGDGCLYLAYSKKDNTYSKMFILTGNILLLNKIQEILIENCGLKKNKLAMPKLQKERGKENIVHLRYGGNSQVERIKDYLYKDCDDLFLTRKKEKFDQDLPKGRGKNRIYPKGFSKQLKSK